MTLEAVLGSTVGAIQAVMVSIWDDTSRAVLISVVAGIVLYFVRSWADGRRVTQSLARALHFELEENQREIMSARFSGLSQANPIKIDGVYRGLLASGNIRYLHKHQESLYRLYSMKSSDNPELLDALEVAMVGVGDTASPFVRKRLAAARRALRKTRRRRRAP